MSSHPDPEYRHFILRGIREGFTIGFNYGAISCIQSKCNMPEPIEIYLAREVALGEDHRHPAPRHGGDSYQQVWGNSQASPARQVGTDNRPVFPMRWKRKLWYKPGTVFLVILLRRRHSQAHLTKFDLESAYRVVLVHPQDQMLLGVIRKGQLYVDGALPFELRSAPKLFTAVPNALLWVMGRHGVHEALLDDYLICGPPGSAKCGIALRTSLDLCNKLGFRIADHKVDGPSTRLPFLGIPIDTAGMMDENNIHRANNSTGMCKLADY